MCFDKIIADNKALPKCDMPLKWYISNNYGDACNPLLFNFLTGVNPVNVDLSYNDTRKPALLMIGSILNCATENDIVWGSGIISKDYVTRQFGQITCLRGPFSRRSIDKAKKYSFDDTYCDPGVLIPCIFNVKKQQCPKYEIGIIPHEVDYAYINKTLGRDYLVIDVTDNPQKITNLISNCKRVISSSLHGIIVADALKIPCAWFKVSDKIIGGKYKFLDYYAGCGVNENYVICNDFTNKYISANDIKNIEFNKPGIHNINGLLRSFPFKISARAFANIRKYYEH